MKKARGNLNAFKREPRRPTPFARFVPATTDPNAMHTSARTRARRGETQEAWVDRAKDKPQLPPYSPRQGYFEKRSNGMHKEQPQEKAQAWLRAVAEEDEEVKDAILHELMGDEDFQDA